MMLCHKCSKSPQIPLSQRGSLPWVSAFGPDTDPGGGFLLGAPLGRYFFHHRGDSRILPALFPGPPSVSGGGQSKGTAGALGVASGQGQSARLEGRRLYTVGSPFSLQPLELPFRTDANPFSSLLLEHVCLYAACLYRLCSFRQLLGRIGHAGECQRRCHRPWRRRLRLFTHWCTPSPLSEDRDLEYNSRKHRKPEKEPQN